MTPAEREAIMQRIARAAGDLLRNGYQGTEVRVPELDEVWAISREPA